MPPLSLSLRWRLRVVLRVAVRFTVVRDQTYMKYQSNSAGIRGQFRSPRMMWEGTSPNLDTEIETSPGDLIIHVRPLGVAATPPSPLRLAMPPAVFG